MKPTNFNTDFKEYYLKNNDLNEFSYQKFKNLPLSYTYCIYMDFFMQNHIFIQILQIESHYFRVGLLWYGNDLLNKGIIKNSLEEAREEGFKEAKNFYSNQPSFDDFEVCEY